MPVSFKQQSKQQSRELRNLTKRSEFCFRGQDNERIRNPKRDVKHVMRNRSKLWIGWRIRINHEHYQRRILFNWGLKWLNLQEDKIEDSKVNKASNAKETIHKETDRLRHRNWQVPELLKFINVGKTEVNKTRCS